MNERSHNLPEFLTQSEVAKRWRVSQRTLEGWRFKRIGPDYTKIGSRILYPRDCVIQFENAKSMFGGSPHG